MSWQLKQRVKCSFLISLILAIPGFQVPPAHADDFPGCEQYSLSQEQIAYMNMVQKVYVRAFNEPFLGCEEGVLLLSNEPTGVGELIPSVRWNQDLLGNNEYEDFQFQVIYLNSGFFNDPSIPPDYNFSSDLVFGRLIGPKGTVPICGAVYCVDTDIDRLNALLIIGVISEHQVDILLHLQEEEAMPDWVQMLCGTLPPCRECCMWFAYRDYENDCGQAFGEFILCMGGAVAAGAAGGGICLKYVGVTGPHGWLWCILTAVGAGVFVATGCISILTAGLDAAEAKWQQKYIECMTMPACPPGTIPPPPVPDGFPPPPVPFQHHCQTISV